MPVRESEDKVYHSVMINIEKNVSLLPYNSFSVDAVAGYFCKITEVHQLQELIQSSIYQNNPRYILGEGSNVLFTKDFQGLVIKIEIKGIEIVQENEERIMIKAGAGEPWHGLVLHCVMNDWGGLENLSLIPGTVGAAPIQNIGAYGVEIKDRIENVEGVDALTGEVHSFNSVECRFEYRESAFKHELKGKYFISSVTLSLTKKNHLLNTDYGAIRDTLQEQNVNALRDATVKTISDAVIRIRRLKLPDTAVVGSAGSFFKNPTIPRKHAELLQHEYPSMPLYHAVNQNVKISAGWLIEQCGWKGKRINNIGVHPHQALVLVNYGGGTGKEIFQLAMNIRDTVNNKFGVLLETEVNIL